MNDCRCDTREQPQRTAYPAGLSHIPRQWAGFEDYRAAMLRALRSYPALGQWRARDRDDVGVMLIEMFAYVLDVVGFYDMYIANRSYLRTATLPRSVAELVHLVGYRPRPAVSAEALLALTVEPGAEVRIPAGTAFRSSGEGGVAPQVFTATGDTLVHASKNEWKIAPQRLPPSNDLLLDTASVSLGESDLVVFEVGSSRPLVTIVEPLELVSDELAPTDVSSEPPLPPIAPMGAARVESLTSAIGPDGLRYTRLGLPPAGRFRWHEFAGGRVRKPSQTAPISRAGFGSSGQAYYLMDGQYTGLHLDDVVIVETAARRLVVAAITRIDEADRTLGDLSVPVTRLRLRTAGGRLPATAGSTLHFRLVDCARLARPVKTSLDAADLAGDVALQPPIAPLVGAQPDRIAIADRDGRGVLVPASVIATPSAPTLRVEEPPELAHVLPAPVRAFGNLVRVVRGEAVSNEVLGSGDAGVGFQSFPLAKSPLSYMHDPSSPTSRRSTLRVWVDGERWHEVPSFFAAGPGDRVYIARHDDGGKTTVTFGDGVHGARLPSGVDNVIAAYRFGAGAEKPAAGTLTQPVSAPPGLRSVLNPAPAYGGADADRPADIRLNAARSALTLGRAVSIHDVEALARDYGVRNAVARPHWNEAAQRAVIQVWIVSHGAPVASELQRALSAQTGPETPIAVDEAAPVEARIAVEITTDPMRTRDEIADAVRAELVDEKRGRLDPGNATIGAGLFRSALLDAIQSVDGVVAVRALSFNGRGMDAFEALAPGQYFQVTLSMTAEEGQ